MACLFVTPTLCKYTYSKVDVASTLHFTSLTPTDIFVIEDDIVVDNNGNVITPDENKLLQVVEKVNEKR